MLRETLTVEELRDLLVARVEAEERWCTELQRRVREAFPSEESIAGDESEGSTSEEEAIESLKKEMRAELTTSLATRYLAGDRTVPIFDTGNFRAQMMKWVDRAAQIYDEELPAAIRNALERMFLTALEQIRDILNQHLAPGDDDYERYGRWLEAVRAIAAERGIRPVEVMEMDDTYDELRRRLFSRSEYLSMIDGIFDRLYDPSAIRAISLATVTAMHPGLAPEDRIDLECRFDEECMPELSEMAAVEHQIARTWLAEEVDRIYGSHQGVSP